MIPFPTADSLLVIACFEMCIRRRTVSRRNTSSPMSDASLPSMAQEQDPFVQEIRTHDVESANQHVVIRVPRRPSPIAFQTRFCLSITILLLVDATLTCGAYLFACYVSQKLDFKRNNKKGGSTHGLLRRDQLGTGQVVGIVLGALGMIGITCCIFCGFGYVAFVSRRGGLDGNRGGAGPVGGGAAGVV
jgi:hypothetical protein